jgi:hypothetical protein
MTTLYFDENTGWTELNETVEEALANLRDDGNVEIEADSTVQTAHGLACRTVAGNVDGEAFIIVGFA